jgi:hypothetical protein
LQNAIQAVKEGREISGESLLVLNTIFSDLSEGHDYVMRAVEMMAALMNAQEAPAEETPEEETPVEETPVEEPMIEDSAPRSISLRLAKAIINNTK